MALAGVQSLKGQTCCRSSSNCGSWRGCHLTLDSVRLNQKQFVTAAIRACIANKSSNFQHLNIQEWVRQRRLLGKEECISLPYPPAQEMLPLLPVLQFQLIPLQFLSISSPETHQVKHTIKVNQLSKASSLINTATQILDPKESALSDALSLWRKCVK